MPSHMDTVCMDGSSFATQSMRSIAGRLSGVVKRPLHSPGFVTPSKRSRYLKGEGGGEVRVRVRVSVRVRVKGEGEG